MRARRLRQILALLIAVCGLAWSPHARADEPGFGWDPRWPKFRSSEYVLSGLAGSAAFVLYFGVRDARSPRGTGGFLFDDFFRDQLRLRPHGQRDGARKVSDWTALSAITWAIAVDSLTVPLARSDTELAGQMLLMDAEAFAVSTLITTSMFKIVARARPSYVECQKDPNYDPLCKSNVMGSFPSGHTNTSFTAAGLSCAHHLHVSLYGDRLADVLACAGTLTLAATTGTLRVLGDRHYATDVLVGAMIGFAVGYGVPTLLHYGAARNSSAAPSTTQPLGQVVPLGPIISGTF